MIHESKINMSGIGAKQKYHEMMVNLSEGCDIEVQTIGAG
jgi:hypothetical protein